MPERNINRPMKSEEELGALVFEGAKKYDKVVYGYFVLLLMNKEISFCLDVSTAYVSQCITKEKKRFKKCTFCNCLSTGRRRKKSAKSRRRRRKKGE